VAPSGQTAPNRGNQHQLAPPLLKPATSPQSGDGPKDASKECNAFILDRPIVCSMKFKQCIVIREDLKLSPGKLAVQTAHAAIMAMERSDKNVVKNWKGEGQRKIVLKVPTLRDLFKVREDADQAGVPAAVVIDAGLTEIPSGTVTVLGLGPASEDLLDKVTGDLKLL